MPLAPRDLAKRRIVKITKDRRYGFSIEFFKLWVQINKPLREVKDELDRVEPVADQWFKQGVTSFRKKRWDEAIESFQNALNKNPYHFQARLLLGEALLELGEIDKSVVELERAYQQDQDETRNALVRALLSQAQTQEKNGGQRRRACRKRDQAKEKGSGERK